MCFYSSLKKEEKGESRDLVKNKIFKLYHPKDPSTNIQG